MDLAIRKIVLKDGTAAVRVAADISAVDLETSKPANGFGKLNRTLYCVKNGGAWLVQRYVTSEVELAAALVAASTDEDRKRQRTPISSLSI